MVLWPHRAYHFGMMLTAEQLAATPDSGQRQELVGGRLITEPPASYDHGRVGLRILRILARFVEEQELGEVISLETGFLLARDPDTVRAPDVAFISRETLERAGEIRGFFPGAPDLAVEVLSPSERAADVHAKVADYLAAGTRVVWVVDPQCEQVSVYRSLLGPRILACDEELGGEDVLPGFCVTVSDFFSPLR